MLSPPSSFLGVPVELSREVKFHGCGKNWRVEVVMGLESKEFTMELLSRKHPLSSVEVACFSIVYVRAFSSW